jgi:hypothetical protein
MILRRKFITLLGGAAAWPRAARAQQGERVRRIGVLLGSTAPDRPDVAGFLQALQQLGWSEGHNLRIDYRWGRGNAADTRKYAQELVALAPDAVFPGQSQRGSFGQDQDQTVGDQVGRGQGERHPQGRQQEGRKAQGARRESKIKIEQNNADQ